MVDPRESAAAIESILEGIGRGVGRPLTQAALATFSEAFEAEAPAGLTFVPRLIPGLVYVSPEQIFDLIDEADSQITPSQTGPLARTVVASLCEGGKLESATALEPVSPSIVYMRFKGHEPRARHVTLYVDDLPSTYYEHGFLFNGERDVSRQAFRQELVGGRSQRGGTPRVIVRLGQLEGPGELSDSGQQKVIRAMGGKTDLEGVGPITSD